MSLRRVLTGILPGKQRRETPTTSIYFAGPMADCLGPHGGNAPVQRVEPNVFLSENTLVVMRHWSGPARRVLAERPEIEVVYFIDDDLWVLEQDNGLPAAYLKRLRRLKQAFDEELRPRATTIVAPSRQILSHFSGVQALQLAPALIHPLAPLSHHDDRAGPVNLVFCATASHLADLKGMSDELAGLLRGNDALHLTTFLGDRVPAELRLDGCTHLAPQSWADYRRTIASSRFHIGLAPLEATAFNQARSGTRLLDHAAFGAAGLYSDTGPFCDLIETGQNGVLVAPQPQAWAEAIQSLVRDPALCRRLADRGQKTAADIGDPARVRQFWCTLLEL